MVQAGQRHTHVTHRRRTIGEIQGCGRDVGAPLADTPQDGFHLEATGAAAGLDAALHLVQRMVQQQVQNPQIVFGPLPGPVLVLQGTAQLVKDRRQLPVSKDVGVVQGCRSSLQRLQVMPRIQHLLVAPVSARMRGDHLAAVNHLNVVAISFDRDRLKGARARHAVAIGVVADHLVLVGLGWLQQAGIEGTKRQGQGPLPLARKALANRFGLTGLQALPVAQTTPPQVNVQGGQVADLGHWRGPVALQVAHAAFDVPLLLRPADQTKHRREGIMADQGLVAVLEPSLAAGQQLRGHGLGVVPPQLMRHTAEEGEGFDQAMQDGLGPFAGQRQREGAVGVGPGGQQHGHLLPAVGEINVDVAKVAFQALAGIVIQRDKGLRYANALEQVQSHALVGAGEAMLVAETAKDFGRGMPLLAGGLFIVLDDGVDDGFERINEQGQRAALIGLRFRVVEDLANLAAGVVKASRQFADAQVFLAVGLANACVLVHADHPPPPCSWAPWRCTSIQEVAGVGPFSTWISAFRWVRIRRGLPAVSDVKGLPVASLGKAAQTMALGTG